MKKEDFARCATYYLLDTKLFCELSTDLKYACILNQGIEELVHKMEHILFHCCEEDLLKIYAHYSTLLQ